MLVLFDIDGTLLLTDGLGVECVRDAVAELFDRPVDPRRASFPGSLDPIIWHDLCIAHDLPDPDLHHDRFRATYGRLLRERLAAEPGRAYALPGVAELLDALAEVEDLALGLLTGNYPETGRLKIAASGLDPERFEVAAWGDDALERRALPSVALERLAQRSGRDLVPGDVVIIGDTPRDVDCARASGCRMLGVATGRYSVRDLLDAGADRAVESLVDTPDLVGWIADGP